ncbi:MAG: EAL domain-containing protein [Nevskiaceae bacterium]|nr:MAG: EAL domain-containing protein [Nevskiaceae bacterium]
MDGAIVQWLTGPGLMPHGYCLAWSPALLWTLVLSHAVIGVAYFSIPLTLMYFVRRQRELLSYNWVFVMFSMFIFACGTTHFISIVDIWFPLYRLDATAVAVTAAISIVTAVAIWPLVPRAVGLLRDHARNHAELQTLSGQLSDSLRRLQASSREAVDLSKKFELTFENAPIGMAIVSLEGRWLVVNQALCAMLGYDERELRTKTFQDITHPDDLQEDLKYVRELLDGRRDRYRLEKRYFDAAGQIISIQLDVSMVRDETAAPLHFIAQIQDITARKRSEALLHEAKELAQVTLSSIGDGVIRTDASGRITFCNDAAAKIIGTTPERMVGWPFHERVRLFRDGGQVQIEDPVARVLDSGEPFRLDLFSSLRAADGSLRPVSDSVSPVRDLTGRIVGAVFVFQDVSEARSLTDRLTQQARQDLLTGLPNRLAFEERLTVTLARARSGGWRGCLLYLDLDHFKIINDTRGHAAGDKLLREIGRLLATRLHEGDYLARLGGDEFAILLGDVDAQGAQRVADALGEAVGDYRLAFRDRIFKIGLSVGIAVIDAANCDAEAVMSQADTACYTAKDHGRGRSQVYQPDDAEIRRAERTLDWAQRIQQAFDGNRYEVHLQQIVDRARQVRGYETLIRMREESGDLIMPNAFLPAAKRMGWMTRIDQWMAGKVLALAASAGSGGHTAYLSLNLSAKSAGDPEFGRGLLTLLDRHEIDGGRLRFEITETEQLQASEAEAHLIAELRRRGFRVWLDDFGTGYNSFDLLKRLRVDGIKLDGSFTRDLLRDPVDRALSEAIIAIGKTMQLEIVAEGVEDEATCTALLAMGVDAMQGYLFHSAQPDREIPGFARRAAR